jgi:hypothetical protein
MSGKEGLFEHLENLLRGRGAHMSFDAALEGWPPALRGRKAAALPYTAWQLLEHMRIAQWDILEFSRDAEHVSPEFPDGYWPSSEAPPDDAAWEKSLSAFRSDLEAMLGLVRSGGERLLQPIPHGTGQTLLREALVLADHNAYHLGQLVLLRRLLGTAASG